MFTIAKWYNNFNSPSVLMIDDLSDAYIGVYKETYKNDWGYLCNIKGSSFDFLTKNLLSKFPWVKATFFTPYLRHAVINENSDFDYKKFAVGERTEFTNFLQFLVKEGHEIAHHGSNHGKYIDDSKPTTVNNWIHEWALFDDIATGVKTTLEGVEKFKDECNIDIVGGKYCGHITRENSQDIIDKCNFLYWSHEPSYNHYVGKSNESFFGKNNIIYFPITFAGNSFVRLTYLSGDKRRDTKKKIFKYFQPLYNLYSYFNLYKLYFKRQIISIQEHNSPSTTAGTAQSANIVTDIKSLNKIYSFLNKLSIWYATCEEIAKYIYVRENSTLEVSNNDLIINFDNYKMILDASISIVNNKKFTLKNEDELFIPNLIDNKYVLNLNLQNGKNIFYIK